MDSGNFYHNPPANYENKSFSTYREASDYKDNLFKNNGVLLYVAWNKENRSWYLSTDSSKEFLKKSLQEPTPPSNSVNESVNTEEYHPKSPYDNPTGFPTFEDGQQKLREHMKRMSGLP